MLLLFCLCCFHPVSNFRSFLTDISFRRWSCQPHSQPLTWRTRLSLFLWVITFDLSLTGGPTSSYATAIIALRIISWCKPHNYIIVNLLNLSVLFPCLTFNNFSVVLLVLLAILRLKFINTLVVYFVFFPTYVNFAHLGWGLDCLLSTFLFVFNFIIWNCNIIFIVIYSLFYYFSFFFPKSFIG